MPGKDTAMTLDAGFRRDSTDAPLSQPRGDCVPTDTLFGDTQIPVRPDMISSSTRPSSRAASGVLLARCGRDDSAIAPVR
jgi:hypothetical protein